MANNTISRIKDGSRSQFLGFTSFKAFVDSFVRILLFMVAIFAVVLVGFIILYLFLESGGVIFEIGIADFIFGNEWVVERNAFGAAPLITATLLVTIGAMAISIPLGIGSAIFISELAPGRLKAVLKSAIELLSGIPSVVYGFFGLLVLTDWLRVNFDLATGKGWAAGSILLGIMALPTIVSVSEDAISSVPRSFREASLAMGATKWQTIRRVIVPAALSGITAAVILGIGRAIGETMAVIMVTGNAAQIPDPIYDVFARVKTITGTLGIEMGEVAIGSTHYHALFALAVLLLLIVLGVNTAANMVLVRVQQRFNPKTRESRSRLPISLTVAYAKYNRRLADLLMVGAGAVFIGVVAGPLVAGVILLALVVSHHLVGRYLHTNIAKELLLLTVIGTIMLIMWGLVTALIGVALIVAVQYLTRDLDARKKQWGAYAALSGIILLVIFLLGVILYYIVSNGLEALSWEFLTESPRNNGREGGIYPAIIGTIYLVLGAIAVAVPLGMGAGVYLAEYAKEGRITRIVRMGIDNLNGTPSIVFGLFGYAFLVLFLLPEFGFEGRSMLAGQLTLAFMVIPTIIRTTEEAVKAVPQAMREGSLAMGASKWQTIYKVVLPPALPGIITGIVLSIGRTAGETAPILFTAVVAMQRNLPNSLGDAVMALPYHLFFLASNVPDAKVNQSGTALVLLLLVLSFYSVASVIRARANKKQRW
jgi:phosphate transport system permease protein